MKGKKTDKDKLKPGSKEYNEIGELTEIDYYCSNTKTKKKKK